MPNNLDPLVTIAIPTYNRADYYLQQSLASALSLIVCGFQPVSKVPKNG
jgi:DNA-binding helix-hairpin-helix protein with protein kinase domain